MKVTWRGDFYRVIGRSKFSIDSIPPYKQILMGSLVGPHHIPITVFTGFLGSGKTSIILSLLPLLPKDYKVVLLKNEFGDVQGTHSLT
jgi:hypothetical protein